jgi:hypothetical protein
MGDIDVFATAFAGFGLFNRRPLAAATWSALVVVALGLLIALFGGMLATIIAAAAQTAGSGAAANGAAAAGALLGVAGGALGFLFLFGIGSVVLSAVIACAVYRAVLEPENTAYFSLRLGPQEGWVMLSHFVLGLLIAIVRIALAIPTLVIGGVFEASGGVIGGHLARFVGDVASLVLLAWLYLRFSMVGPMSFSERKFRLFESWTLTRGHGWRLLGVGVVVWLWIVALYAVLVLLGVAGGFATLGGLSAKGDIRALVQNLSPATLASLLTSAVTLALALAFVGGVLIIPVGIAPWAQAYRRLAPPPDLEETFT